MSSLHFSHVAITCKDPLVIERFYTRYFGFERARVVVAGEDQTVFLKMGNVRLELFRATGEALDTSIGGAGPEYPGLRHLAFQVDNVDGALAGMGEDAHITLGPLSFDEVIPGWRTVWLSDPEGNIVEISQGYVDQETPPPLDA